MNARRGIVSGLIMTAALLALAEGGPVAAQAGSRQSEKINKVVVKFSDLNLQQEKDAKRLLRRIKRAAVRVCGGTSGTAHSYALMDAQSYRKCVKESNERAQAMLLANLGNRSQSALDTNDLDTADDIRRRALMLNQVLERKEGMVEDLRALSEIAVRRNDLKTAGIFRERAFTFNQELERPEQAIADLNQMGWIASRQNDLDAARNHYRLALALSAEMNNDAGMANYIRQLGLVEAKRGDLDTAEALHRSSLALNRIAGRKEGVAMSLSDLGRLARLRGDTESAKQYHQQALALDSDLGAKKQMAAQHGSLWPLALEQNRLDEAEVHLRQAVRLAREAGVLDDAPALGEVQMGLIRLARGHKPEACAAWARAEAIYRHIGNETQGSRVREMMRDSQCHAVRDPSVTAALQ